MNSSLKPLENTLESILGRLAALESKAGIMTPPSTSSAATDVGAAASNDDDGIPPSIQAFDAHIQKSLTPFTAACNAIPGLLTTGTHIAQVWDGMRAIVAIGTKCKKPSNVQSALMPHLKPIQDAMSSIRNLKLDRKYDWHIKGIMEMLVCASWVITTAPPAPSSFVKETIGSSDFWCNKIRKEYKGGKDESQIAFCDTMKALILDLAGYLKEYHLSGLMWNPNGIDIADYKVGGASTKTTAPTALPSGADIMKELAAKRTSDGTSAATGLKKVTRDQQTWRKEYKDSNNSGGNAPVASSTNITTRPTTAKTSNTTKIIKPPVCKFVTVGSKWIVENQTKTSNPNGVCTVEIQNPKEQVYIYKCEEATIQIKGKLKSVILDSCKKANLVFDTAISSCEVVNCKGVQIQSTGVCPSFSIDKTDGCLIYLSKEAISVTNFVTSKSTEMNVSWPDEKTGEQKEAPIPEQFVHRLVNGAVTSEVSDLYH